MEAVDPRSLLSGHYVQLGLTQRLEPGQTCPAGGDQGWIALRRQGETYLAVGGAASREQAQLLGLPVKGGFDCAEPTPAADGGEAFPGWLTLRIGVDRFHINQADALRISACCATDHRRSHARPPSSRSAATAARLKGLHRRRTARVNWLSLQPHGPRGTRSSAR